MIERLLDRDRFPWWSWGIAATLLTLARTPRWSIDAVRVIRPPDNPVLAESLWNSAMSSVVPEPWRFWPYTVFAVLTAITSTVLVRTCCRTNGCITAALFAMGVCLSLRPEHLSTLAILSVLAMTATRPRNHAARVRTLCVLALASLLVSLEVGLLLLTILAIWPAAQSQLETRRSRIAASAGLIGITVLMVTARSSFALTLLRPVLWTTRPDFTELQPSLSGPLELPQPQFGHLCLLICAGFLLRSTLWNVRQKPITAAIAILIALIGTCCGLYTTLAVAALATISVSALSQENALAETDSRNVSPLFFRSTSPMPIWVCTLIVVSSSYWSHGPELLFGGFSSGRLDARQWQIKGTVALTNLDDTTYWTSPSLRSRFRLLLTDRFDIPKTVAADYVALCRDLRIGKRELYLRVDGSPGGFSPRLKALDVDMISMETGDALPIRQMSVDPKWRIMALDGSRTVFGRHDDPATRMPTARAAELLFHLEWPKRQVSDGVEGTLVLGTMAENRKIATLLAAIRLPYAGLRVIAGDESEAASQVRAWCYTELAHRAIRQTGQPSLLDHPRALLALDEVKMLADRTFQVGEASSTEDVAGNSINALKARGLNTTISEMPLAERDVRDAIRRGRLQDAEKTIKTRLSAPVAGFYLAFLQSNFDPDALKLAIDTCPRQDLRAEGLFYLGCRALESGNVEAALKSFQESRQEGSDFALAPLRDFYQQQMLQR